MNRALYAAMRPRPARRVPYGDVLGRTLPLDINQSTVSRHMRDVEEDLGTDLFRREPRHGGLVTKVRWAFLYSVRKMFKYLDRAKVTAVVGIIALKLQSTKQTG